MLIIQKIYSFPIKPQRLQNDVKAESIFLYSKYFYEPTEEKKMYSYILLLEETN